MENRINNRTIKYIAILTMLIDHIATGIISPIMGEANHLYVFCRLVGRISFPLFCYLIAEGAVYTHNRYKYLLRLTIFTFISEIPFDLFNSRVIFYPDKQNVLFTLTLGLLIVCLYKNMIDDKAYLYMFIFIAAMGFVGFFTIFFKNEYGFSGILLILIFHAFRNNIKTKTIIGFFIITILWSIEKNIYPINVSEIIEGILFQTSSVFAFILIYHNNNQKIVQSKCLKILFYIFYPIHFLLLSLIRYYLSL